MKIDVVHLFVEDEETLGKTEPRWCDVKVGDGLTCPDGALFIVDSRAIDDGKQVTFLLRCVVPPALDNLSFGDACMYSRPNNQSLPEGFTIVKPTR